MRRVAVFGNTGGGKSYLSKQLAEITGLPLYVLDILQFADGTYKAEDKNGGKISSEEYLKLHAEVIKREQWIIDGYGNSASSWERFEKADTLVFIDLPIPVHYWGVTKRFLSGMLKNPSGWPKDSPVWSSTLDSYRVVGLCHRHLTPKYREFVDRAKPSKKVHHLRSRSEMAGFVRAMIEEQSSVRKIRP
jgi:adenylate kinase family enzyme